LLALLPGINSSYSYIEILARLHRLKVKTRPEKKHEAKKDFQNDENPETWIRSGYRDTMDEINKTQKSDKNI